MAKNWDEFTHSETIPDYNTFPQVNLENCNICRADETESKMIKRNFDQWQKNPFFNLRQNSHFHDVAHIRIATSQKSPSLPIQPIHEISNVI